MIHPFLENTAKAVQYILLWFAYALVQTIVLYSIVALPLWMIMLDGFVHAIIYAIIGLLLWSVVRYGNYAVLNVQQRVINYIALALLTILIWLGIGFGLFYGAFGLKVASHFVSLLPIRGFIGLLIYWIIIERFKFALYRSDSLKQPVFAVEDNDVAKPIKVVERDRIERITVKSGAKIHVVLTPDIYYLQADGDYVQIFTADGKYLKEQTMKYFEEHLPENLFVRVHRSAIVNVAMISRIELYEKQNQLLTLKNGHQLKTSPAGYKLLRVVLNL